MLKHVRFKTNSYTDIRLYSERVLIQLFVFSMAQMFDYFLYLLAVA